MKYPMIIKKTFVKHKPVNSQTHTHHNIIVGSGKVKRKSRFTDAPKHMPLIGISLFILIFGGMGVKLQFLSHASTTCATTVASVNAAQAAVSAASAGDTVCMAAGTYGAITLSGSHSANVTLEPDPSLDPNGAGKVTFTGLVTMSGSYITLHNFYMMNAVTFLSPYGGTAAAHDTLDHNNILGGVDGGGPDCSVPSAPGSCSGGYQPIAYIIITGNKIWGQGGTQNPSGEDALHFNHHQHLTISYNEIYDNIQLPGGSTPHVDSLQSVWGGSDLVFDHNYLHDSHDEPFILKDGDLINVTITNNLVLRQNIPDSGVGTENGIIVNTHNSILRNNTFWGSSNYVFVSKDNNPPASCSGDPYCSTTPYSTTFDHNVFEGFDNKYPGSAFTTTINSEGFNIFQSNPASFTPAATDSVNAAPSFMNTAVDDYRLASNPNGIGVDWTPSQYIYGPVSNVQTNCITKLAACGYPDAGTNDGAHGTLTPASGTVVLSTPGQTYQNIDLTGCISIKANNVTIKNVRVTCNGSEGIFIYSGTQSVPIDGTTITDTTIRGTAPTSSGAVSDGVLNAGGNTNTTAQRLYIYNSGSTDWNGPGVISDSYLIVDSFISGAHDEAIYEGGGDSGIQANHDTLLNNQPQTAVVLNGGDYGPAQHDRVTNSIMAGGGWMIYGGYGQGYPLPIDGPHILNNRFARSSNGGGGYFASGGSVGMSASIQQSTIDWSGNCWDDTPTIAIDDGGGSLGTASGCGGSTSTSPIPPPPPPPDTTPPTVSLTSPASNATLSATTTLTATAADNVAVTKVEFYQGTTLIGTSTSTTSPYSYSWDTKKVANGTYSLSVKAYDAAGNSASSTPAVSVRVNNPVPPPPPPTTNATTIWAPTAVPGTPDAVDSPVELGTKFRSDVAGNITGVRFYKGTGNTGTHVGGLWNAAGTRLATVTFANETASGWQQADFSSPVAIAANTTYIISYYSPSGHYAFDKSYFATQAVDNPPLHALKEGTDGSNGVYLYGGGFPSSTYNSSNYWVDVVFSSSTTAPPTPDTTPPTAPGSPAATATSATQVNLSWTASTDPGTNASGVAKYNVLRNGAVVSQVNTPSTAYTDTGLTANTTYSYSIQAVDNAGNISPSSNTVSTTTPALPADTTPPPTPTVTGSTVSSSQINLSWPAVADPSGIKEYRVYKNGSSTPTATLTIATANPCNTATPAACSWGEANLSPGTTYTYQVLAVDGAGNVGGKSNTVSVVTGGGGTQANCFASPGSCGYPDPNYSWNSASAWASGGGGVGPNNGMTAIACSSLPASGSVSSTIDGQTIQNLNITGTISVVNNNVTINNVCVTTAGGAGSIAINLNGSTGVVVKNSTVRGTGPAGSSSLEATTWGGDNVTLSHDYFYNTSDPDEYSGPTINDSYFNISGIYDGAHAEDIYINNQTLVANHNTLFNNQQQTATVFGNVQNSGSYTGACHNHITLTSNLLAGGGYLLYPCGNATSVGDSTTDITNNRFARCLTQPITYHSVSGGTTCGTTDQAGVDTHGYWPNGGYYGMIAYNFTGPGQVWNNNAWDDTPTQTICPDGTNGCAGTPPPPDTTPPTTTITAPLASSTVSGILNITANATDNVGVTKVELYIDNLLAATDVAAPYVYSWDTTTYSNGAHTLTTKAYDAAGNVGTSTSVTVTVNNPVPPPPPGPKPGDANGDGKIDIFDLSILASNWGRSGVTRAQGDLNGDSVVNIFDLSILASNWNK